MNLVIDCCVAMPLYFFLILRLDEDFGGLKILRLSDDVETDIERSFACNDIKKLIVLESVYCH